MATKGFCKHESLHFEQFGQKLVCDECKRAYFIQLEDFAINDIGYWHESLHSFDKRQNPMPVFEVKKVNLVDKSNETKKPDPAK